MFSCAKVVFFTLLLFVQMYIICTNVQIHKMSTSVLQLLYSFKVPSFLFPLFAKKIKPKNEGNYISDLFQRYLF